MKFRYGRNARKTLGEVVLFIDSKNIVGAGQKWFETLESSLNDRLRNPLLVPVCNNWKFKKENFRCLNFKDWVMAFRIQLDVVVITAVLHKSRLSD